MRHDSTAACICICTECTFILVLCLVTLSEGVTQPDRLSECLLDKLRLDYHAVCCIACYIVSKEDEG